MIDHYHGPENNPPSPFGRRRRRRPEGEECGREFGFPLVVNHRSTGTSPVVAFTESVYKVRHTTLIVREDGVWEFDGG